ncbi:MAG: DUF58 domain-containing protein [Alphaproteobacteria bacterium]|nr:DUF58 domain-containing protein [Alphaproteobacteria bacterium]
MSDIDFITPQLIAKATALYQQFRLSPESHLSVAHTEKIWLYRTYEGSDPISSIDWRQSARSQTLLVRAHEPIQIKTCLFTLVFAAQDFQEKPEDLFLRYKDTATILLALSYALANGQRKIGWITPERKRTKTLAALPALFQNGLHDTYNTQKEKSDDLAAIFAERSSKGKFVILSAQSGADEKNTQHTLHTLASFGFQGLLFLNDADPAQTLLEAAKRAQWPVVTHRHDVPAAATLAQLFQISFPHTR